MEAGKCNSINVVILMECFMNNVIPEGLASSTILILWNKTGRHNTAWIPRWQLQVWGQRDREQMSSLWIVSLKPASSGYETQEWALILEQDGLANSAPNSLGSSPGSLARPPDSTPWPQGYHLPLPLQRPQRFRQQVFLGCLPHLPRLGEEDVKGVWVIFRTLSIPAAQGLLCRQRGEAVTPTSFLMHHSLEQSASSTKRGRGKLEPSSRPPSPLCHNNSISGGRGGVRCGEESGLLLWILDSCWVFRFRYPPGSQSGERIRVSNYSSHPRTQCSASHILTISKTWETTHIPTEYFYTHGKPHTKWRVIKQFGLENFFFNLNLCLLFFVI